MECHIAYVYHIQIIDVQMELSVKGFNFMKTYKRANLSAVITCTSIMVRTCTIVHHIKSLCNNNFHVLCSVFEFSKLVFVHVHVCMLNDAV